MDTSTLGILVIGIGVLAKAIWELYLCPLARQHIPGPRRAAVSDVWDYWVQLRKRRTLTFHDLFERYGPVVRVGPNRVAFRNIDTVRTIYSTHHFRKSSWWSVLTIGNSQNMVSTSDPAYHARLRRLSGPAFRGENIRAAGHVLMQEMDALVARLQRDCADGGYVNIIQLFPQLTLDILGLAVLGVRFDQVAAGQESKFSKHLDSWVLDKAFIQPLPNFIRKLPIPWLQEILAGDPAITRYVEDLYMQVDEKSSEGRLSMLATYKEYRDAETGQPAPISMIVGELGAMVVAGMENSAIALTYLVYHLALREDMWKIMRSEVSTVDIQAEDLVDTLRQLPYMNAFIREVFRVSSPAAIFLERIVPAGGATLDGYFLPAGTQVGSQAYSSHHDERVFPQPHVVDPFRWVRLDNTTGKYVNREDVTPEMNSHYFPFSFGVRSCVGKALADLELALITTTLVRNFRINLHDTVTPDSMSPVELIAIRARSYQCLMNFEYAPLATG